MSDVARRRQGLVTVPILFVTTQSLAIAAWESLPEANGRRQHTPIKVAALQTALQRDANKLR